MAALNPCKDQKTALAIISTITQAMKPGTQKDALESVAGWIQSVHLDMPDTPEERRALALKIKTELRNRMSIEERGAEAAFYLEGID